MIREHTNLNDLPNKLEHSKLMNNIYKMSVKLNYIKISLPYKIIIVLVI